MELSHSFLQGASKNHKEFKLLGSKNRKIYIVNVSMIFK